MVKLKTCPFCEKEVKAFWKAKTRDRDPCCKNCLSLYNEKYEKETKEVGGYPRTGSGKPRESSKNFKNKAIAPVSDKQAARLREYRKVRDIYMKQHSVCQCCNSAPSTDLHHKAGRIGHHLINVDNFMAVCRPCHQRIETEPKWAKEYGYSLNRL